MRGIRGRSGIEQRASRGKLGPFRAANSGKYKALRGVELLLFFSGTCDQPPPFLCQDSGQENGCSIRFASSLSSKVCPSLVISSCELKAFVNNSFTQGPKLCVTSADTETHFRMISHRWLWREIYHLVPFNQFLLYWIGMMLVLTKHAVGYSFNLLWTQIPFEFFIDVAANTSMFNIYDKNLPV